jgi:hypothetical protein
MIGRRIVEVAVALLVAASAGPLTAGDAAPRFDHSGWSRVLAVRVDASGRVAYRELQEKDSPALQQYLSALAAAEPGDWPRAEQLAFWINAYNAGIVSAVLQGESAESQAGRDRLFKTWKFRVAGQERTLDEIEHRVLRSQFAEPRIHFAIVCASASCPPLRAEAYVAAELDAQLDAQARAFLQDSTRNVIDSKTKTLRLSAVFDWFHEDFEKAAGSVPAFVARYAGDPETRKWLLTGPVKIEHLEYDWTLNAQTGQQPPRRPGP